MQNGKGSLIFALFVACAVAFVWHTSNGLPVLVASHFGASGMANGFMPHKFYIFFMIGFIIGLPSLMVFITVYVLGSSKARINIPNRDYWLAPERYTETIAFLRACLIWFGVLLVTFLCYVHWIVVVANSVQPAHLSVPRLFGGLFAFFVALLLWLKLLLGHFRAHA
jgi:hypothetical protein